MNDASPGLSRMPRTGKAPAAWLLAWLAGLALLGAAALSTLELSYDLALFLPQPNSPAERILIERVGDSPGSKFILVAMPDLPGERERFISRVGDLGGVQSVLTETGPVNSDMTPEPVFSHRYLLAEVDWSSAALAAELDDRAAELGLGSDVRYEALVKRDPGLVILDVLDALNPTSDDQWLTRQGQRVVVVVTSAPAFELQAQAEVIGSLRSTAAEVFGSDDRVELSGAGVFGVALRETIQAEATWRSLWASLAIVTVLLLAYRSFSPLLLSALPLATGVVTGVLVVGLVFGTVHGITLAFGFTLLGVAIDFPLHYLSHRRDARLGGGAPPIWPTLALSALSTVLAYSALLFGGAEGMAQLGAFSASGVTAAALSTRFLLPRVAAPGGAQGTPDRGDTRQRRFWHLALCALVCAGLWSSLQPWWESDLSALSPVPPERLQREGELRATLGAPSIRYQVAIEGAELQPVLEAAEDMRGTLGRAVDRGWIDGFQDVTALLPSERTQRRRQAAIPGSAELARRLREATEGSVFSAEIFDAFLIDAEQARRAQPLRPEDFQGTGLEEALGQYLYRNQAGGWTALASLTGEPQRAGLETLLGEHVPTAELVDYRTASNQLVDDYRRRTLRVLGIVFLAICGLLVVRVQRQRALWSLLTVVTALLVTATALRLAGGPLNLYHLTGLVLVAGLGLDYTLFLGKETAIRGSHLHGVATCMASTVAAFGVLAFSGIPALHSLGSAVALGSLACFVLALLGTDRWRRERRSGNQQVDETA